MGSSKQRVEVYVRIKPTDKFANDVINISSDLKTLIIHAKEEKKKGYINNQILDWKFNIDGILNNASQSEVFSKCASNLIMQTLSGYNSTLFAYGQTGGGKTYTMTGTTNDFQHRGIIPRAISQLYKEIEKRHEYEITVRISYLEIYKEEMYDLLDVLDSKHHSNMNISENEKGMTYVKGLSCCVAKNEEDALTLLFQGESNRIISQHQLNRNSSRSHCIFTIHVESHCITDSEIKYTTSKLNLVDLAGSERIGKTFSTGETQEEALYINKSLTFLEQTVIALEDKSRFHVPYRQSKLTHILKDSIGGNCATVMLGNVWGEANHIEETLSTLRFASRAMNIQCHPSINSFYNPQLLCKKYEKEISLLHKELAMYNTLSNRSQINYEPLSELQVKDINMQVQKYIESDEDQIEVVNLRQIHEIFRQFKQILQESESGVLSKTKDKNNLQDKNDLNEKAFENMLSLNERSPLVGESDGNGFNVGRAGTGVKPAASSAVANVRKKNKKGRDIQENDRKISQALSTVFPKSSTSTQSEQKNGTVEDVSSSSHLSATVTTVPPPKHEAFEMFKGDAGKECNQIFQDNKEILRNKKTEAKSVSKCLNNIKKSIDDIKKQLEVFQEKNEFSSNDSDEYIFEQGEFDLAQKLRLNKNDYRSNHELLQSLNSDILYCEKLVKQCRQTLLAEFENWYEMSFDHSLVKTISEDKTIETNIATVKEDNGEIFRNVQKDLLMKHPESYAFYNARLQTDRIRLYNNSGRKRMDPVLPKLKNVPRFASMLAQ